MELNKELDKEIKKIHKEIGKDVDKRLKEYKEVWEKGTEEDIFAEVAFCVLTPQSKARNAWKAIETLRENGLLFSGEAEEIAEYLNIVRFKNNKAKYLVELRNLMTRDGKLMPKAILTEQGDVFQKRKWIFDNIKGMGMKEANHLLRNLGFGQNIAILDRHILRNVAALGVIDEVPKSITEKNYYEIEEKMREYSKISKITMDKLDLILWYKEAGEIFK
jgi:N-glycosylase/DNA lyase